MSARRSATRAPDRAPEQAQERVAGALPAVDLLPPQVRARRAVRTARRWCVAVVVGVLLLTGGLCFVGFGDRVLAEAELLAAEQDSDALLAELATYSDVVRVRSDITRTRQAIAYGMRNEVLWADLVERFDTALPHFARAESMSIAIVFDRAVLDDAENPFVSGESIGEIAWVITVPVLAQSGDLLPAVDAADGLFDTTFTRVERVDGEGVHRVTGSVLIDPSVRSGRFAVEDAAAPDAGEEEAA